MGRIRIKLFINLKFSVLCPIVHRWPLSWHDPRCSGSVLLPAWGRNRAQRASFTFPRWPDIPFRVRGLWLWIPYALLTCCVGVFDNLSSILQISGFHGVTPETRLFVVTPSCFSKGPQISSHCENIGSGTLPFCHDLRKCQGYFHVFFKRWVGYTWVKVSQLG